MKLKNDKFRKARGGYSRLLEISCSSCGEKLFSYQKDGPGIIKRMYVDRIYGSIVGSSLRCKKCNYLIGNLTIYEKENRPAFAIKPGTIKKKIIKLD
jgi:C4-type Zn-finger protein